MGTSECPLSTGSAANITVAALMPTTKVCCLQLVPASCLDTLCVDSLGRSSQPQSNQGS